MYTYPLITAEMIEPAGAPIPTAVAKRLYKEYMVRIGFLERRQVSEYVKYLSDEMALRESSLRDEFESDRELLADEIAGEKESIVELRLDLKETSDPAGRAEILAMIQDSITRLADLRADYKSVGDALRSFRKDKRSFLVEYINAELRPRSR